MTTDRCFIVSFQVALVDNGIGRINGSKGLVETMKEVAVRITMVALIIFLLR